MEINMEKVVNKTFSQKPLQPHKVDVIQNTTKRQKWLYNWVVFQLK